MADAKRCTKCGIHKPISQFYRRPSSPDGLRGWCRVCDDVSARKWDKANKAKRVEITRNYQKRNQAETNARWYAWREANPEKHKRIRSGSSSRYQKRHPALNAAKENRRRASKLNASPSWANQFFIEEAYELAALRTKLLGFRWHVDHIVPLRSERVCGLHVESNLQVIPALLNISKGNRTWPQGELK